MKRVYQTKFGETGGNCQSACIASLLELDIDTVPNFCVNGNRRWLEDTKTFLLAYGLTIFFISPNPALMEEHNPDALYLISGLSPRGLQHVVIGKAGKIIHDPHPDGGGVEENGEPYGLLVKAGGEA